MPFDPVRFRLVAKYLADEATLGDQEAIDRTVVGRTFYAVFLQARLYLRQRGVRAVTVGAVARALEQIPGASDSGKELLRLHGLRNRCDYDDTNEFPHREALRAVRLATRVESTLGSLS